MMRMQEKFSFQSKIRQIVLFFAKKFPAFTDCSQTKTPAFRRALDSFPQFLTILGAELVGTLRAFQRQVGFVPYAIDFIDYHVNDDGRINGTDVTLLRRYITGGYGVELKPSHGCFEHSLVRVSPIAETCTSDGNIEYWRCSSCNKYYGDIEGRVELTPQDTVIKAKDHTYSDNWYFDDAYQQELLAGSQDLQQK